MRNKVVTTDNEFNIFLKKKNIELIINNSNILEIRLNNFPISSYTEFDLSTSMCIEYIPGQELFQNLLNNKIKPEGLIKLVDHRLKDWSSRRPETQNKIFLRNCYFLYLTLTKVI